MQIGHVGADGASTDGAVGGGDSALAKLFSTVLAFGFRLGPLGTGTLGTGKVCWTGRRGTRGKSSLRRKLSPTKIKDSSAAENPVERREGGSKRRLSPVETYSSVNESSVRSIIELLAAISP